MTLLTFEFIVALLLLNKSADWFARGTALVAELTGMPRLWIGAILGGFVTSIPEKLICCIAAYKGHSEIALGNGIGSVTFNCVLMGICLLQTRMPIQKAWFRDHGIPMLLACLVLFGFCLRDTITRPVAALFVLLVAFYVVWSIRTTEREPVLAHQADEAAGEVLSLTAKVRHRWWVASLLMGISIPILFLSSDWLVHISVRIAQQLEISESVIALTLVTIGTSLPELAATIAATRRGHVDTTIGLIFGSNVFVGMGAVGISGLLGPLPVTAANRLFDLPVMLLAMTIPFLPLLVGRVPGRITGGVLLAGYALYVYALFTLYGVFA